MSSPLIRLESVSKQYSRGDALSTVLEDVSMDVREGEFTAIQGPSGSGKSTLLHILGLLDSPSKGTYVLDGRDVSGLSDDELSELRNRSIGFVFQSFYLVPYATALENVILPGLYGPKSRRELTRKAGELFEQMGLSERADYKPSSLSGGQQQRVALARALINEPRLILADEPTGQLDTGTSKEIMELLSRINSRGQTVIVVTHDDLTAGYARRVVRVRDGRVEDGSS